jgi:hypothetical protein
VYKPIARAIMPRNKRIIDRLRLFKFMLFL